MLLESQVLPTIATPRLRLRWLTPQDAPALFANFGDPVVCRYWSRPPLPNIAAERTVMPLVRFDPSEHFSILRWVDLLHFYW